ncbi:MAG TPA: hypothetical protein VG345_00800 [Bryobacteraceae bacterium]|nr:hypothetical protein [Bryobacteraceae bacterium]
MSNINIGGLGATGDIKIDDASLFSKANLTSLVPKTQDFANDLQKPLNAAKLNSVAFDPKYTSPDIALDSTKCLTIAVDVKPSLQLYRGSDSPLLGKDDFTPEIAIGGGECWIGFQIGATVELTAIGDAPNGIGVEIDQTTGAVFTTYKRFDSSVVLRDAMAATLSEFKIPANAGVLRAQTPGTVLTSDISGTVTVTGEWALPGSVNALALADTTVPAKIQLEIASSVALEGSIAVSGEFVFRSWKKSDTDLLIGLYKKKGTTLTVSFLASAGMEAEEGTTDLIKKVFGLLAPKADTSVLGADAGGIKTALKQSVDHSLLMSLNASCSAAFSDESAFVYSVDLTRHPDDTDAALNAAIRGNWTPIARLPNSREIKSAIGHTIDTNHKMVVNLLGIYNYGSIADFIKNCTVVHCIDDGSATITDTETAKRITVAANPYQAVTDQLRHALSEAAISTAAYSFAKTANSCTLTSSQTLVIYNRSADARKLTNELAPAVALGLATPGQIAAAIGGGPHNHALVQFEQKIDDAAARQMFLSPATGKPWQPPELVKIGIAQLRALLDPNDPADKRRIDFLDHWPQDPPPAPWYVDWLDITWWADSVANAAAKWVAAKAAFENVPRGDDPALNPAFMQARKDLARALLNMSKNEHSAFTPGWPLAVMHEIARGQSACSVNASWDSKIQLQLPAKSATA